MFNLAELLCSGTPGVPFDLPRALALHQRAVNQHGHVSSMIALAIHFWRSDVRQGVLRDLQRVFNLFNQTYNSGELSNFDKCLFSLFLCSESRHRDIVQAKLVLEDILVYDPNDPNASFQLAHILTIEGDDDRSTKRHVTKLLDAAKKNVLDEKYTADQYGGNFTPNMMKLIELGHENFHIPSVLSIGEGKPRQCLLLLVGGQARGKSSTLRSLIGEHFDNN